MTKPKGSGAAKLRPRVVGIAVERDGDVLRVAAACGQYCSVRRVTRLTVQNFNRCLTRHRGQIERQVRGKGWRWCTHDTCLIAAALNDWEQLVAVDNGRAVGARNSKRRVHDLTAFNIDSPTGLSLADRARRAHEDGVAVARCLKTWGARFDVRVTPQAAGMRRLRSTLDEQADVPGGGPRRRGRPPRGTATAQAVREHIIEAHTLQRPLDGRRVLLSGGQSEAFGRGLYDEQVVYADISGSYLAAARMTPLPVSSTRWEKIVPGTPLDELDGRVGFAYVKFEFSRDCLYPALPVRVQVRGQDQPRTYRVLRGATWATLAELRAAGAWGAEIQFEGRRGEPAGYSFLPGPDEREHPVHAFCREVMGLKDESPKGSAARAFYKQASVATIGKLAEQSPRGEFVAHAVPEWHALILGTARATAGDIVAASGALLVLTDGFLIQRHRMLVQGILNLPVVQRLREVGSDLRVDVSADAALILRSQAGALLVHPRSEHDALASDERWSVIKVWQSSVGAAPSNYAAHVLALARGEPHLIRAARGLTWHEARQRRKRRDPDAYPGARMLLDLEPDGWGHHRALKDRDAPLRRWTWATPYASIERALEAREKAGRASRPRVPRTR